MESDVEALVRAAVGAAQPAHAVEAAVEVRDGVLRVGCEEFCLRDCACGARGAMGFVRYVGV
jgi:hypothetical protein